VTETFNRTRDTVAQADQLERELLREGQDFIITPAALSVGPVSGGREGRDNAGASAQDSFGLAKRISGLFGKVIGRQAGPVEDLGMAMALGLLLGALLFIAAAVLGERNALWIPGIILIAAAVGSLVS
jgi:lipid-binding SYLF domain-containing protein